MLPMSPTMLIQASSPTKAYQAVSQTISQSVS